MELLSFCGRLVQKVKISCFSDSFFQRTTQQSDGSCNVTSDSPLLYKTFKKQPLYFCNHIWKKSIVRKEYCSARHDDKMCLLPNCKNHIMFIGNNNELLQKLDAFCFDYQHVDCLSTRFKYCFSGKIVVKSGQLFDSVQRAVHFNHQNIGVDRMSSVAKKRLLRKKYQKHLLSSFQKTKVTQTSGSVFADRNEPVKRTKLELKLIKNVDCFPDGHDNYRSNLVSFKTISL